MFCVSDWPGHWFAMVPTGWALQAAGHEVRVVCAPSQAAPLTRAGLTPVPVLDGWDMALQGRLQNYLDARDGLWPFDRLPPHPLTGEPLESLADFDADRWFADYHPELVRAAGRGADAAVAFGRAWRPDLVLHDQLSLEGPLVGRVTGAPSVLHLWGPFGPCDSAPGLIPVPLDFSDAFRRHGVEPLSAEGYTRVVDPCPAGVAPPLPAGERLPVRFVPYNGPGTVPDPAPVPDHPAAGRSGRPRVCVVWGTSVTAMFGPASFAVPRVVEALAGLDAEVVLTVTGADRERIGALPPGMRLLEQAPLHLLLPGCDLVVHHGGAGCTMTALAAGVPQLILPNGLDQHVNAARVAAAGAGLSRPNAGADAGAVRAAAEELLGSAAAAEAARLLVRQAGDRPPPAALAGVLERLAAEAADRCAPLP
ncbi:DUF1205 domain-containing protein [Streptacidiphilus sp. ASG 303]|uniref:nucleotide disphospho-sugar-binding domain-containing protein n=1 Tax=Streptacidiphilus sp. ASG 303 TaxID=2896847 RepID=UPI001E56B0F2|nr:nucleotide disphospho-sugar-binding domain-containing protein [Streptacidiphilus sp. ASG 303]MCD0485144.1 DUF1205 domain-containing protein [Streptacidiphilus sp. ASG 303]